MATDFQGNGYRARIVQDLPPPKVSEENADVLVTLDSGESYAGVLATTRNIDYLLRKFAADAQCAHGAYVWISHLVVLRDFEQDTICAAVEDLVKTGEIAQIFAVSK